MKFLHILVLAASVSALTLDPRHHKGRTNKASKNNTARNFELGEASEGTLHEARSAPVALDIEAREVEARHHKGKTNKASKNNNNNNTTTTTTTTTNARFVDTEAKAPVDLINRDSVE